MTLLTIGINHKTAPVEIRERVAFAPESLKESLQSLLSLPGVDEGSILSTCNRTEITCWHQGSKALVQLPRWLNEFHKFQPGHLNPYIYQHQDSAAVRHTLRVACGLDSLVLGEPQILGQLKTAYQHSLEHQSLGRYLSRLYQHTFATAKQVRTETAIGASAVSVAFAAVSLAKQIFGNLDKKTAVLIGAGETVELTARHLRGQNIGNIIIVNRTLERAEQLAQTFEAEATTLPNLPDTLPKADIVIASTASPLPILGKGAVERALKIRKHCPIFMVDIAVPRDIEPQVNELDDVYLYTVDDLQDVIKENQKSRQQAAEQAEELVEVQVTEFMGWLKSQDAVHTIRACREKAQTIADAVREDALRMQASGKSTDEIIDYLSRTLTNKLLHAPSSTLNKAAREGRQDLLEAAVEIFKLDNSD